METEHKRKKWNQLPLITHAKKLPFFHRGAKKAERLYYKTWVVIALSYIL
jgi:hypothetical protein